MLPVDRHLFGPVEPSGYRSPGNPHCEPTMSITDRVAEAALDVTRALGPAGRAPLPGYGAAWILCLWLSVGCCDAFDSDRDRD